MPSPVNDADNATQKILGLVALSAIFSFVVSFAVHGVRNWAMGFGSFLAVSSLSFGVLVVAGIGGAWLVSRSQSRS